LEKIDAEVIQENIETGLFETNQTLEKGKSARTQLYMALNEIKFMETLSKEGI